MLSSLLGGRLRSSGAGHSGQALVAEWVDSAVVISHMDDSPLILWRLLRKSAVPVGEVLVLMSSRAVDDAACGAMLRSAVEHGVRTWGATRVWVAADGLARPFGAHAAWLSRLAEGTRVELLAPDGPMHTTADGTLYVGSGTGGTGWRSFRAGGRGGVAGHRFPTPRWEPALPDGQLRLGEVVVEPIPAGVLLRGADAPPVTMADPAFHVPLDPGGPTLVLRHLAEPLVEAVAVAGVFAELPAQTAVRIDGRFLSPPARTTLPEALRVALEAQGIGCLVRRPSAMPLAVRRPAGERSGLLAEGWRRIGDRRYRSTAAEELEVEVTPAGIQLRENAAGGPSGAAFVEPREGVLTLSHTVSDRLIELLGRVLAAGPVVTGVTVAGATNHAGAARLAASVNGQPAPEMQKGISQRPANATSGRVEVVLSPAATRPGRGDNEVTEVFSADTLKLTVPAETSISDQADIGEQRRHFASALGSSYADITTWVDAALASWPVSHQPGSAGAKADLVAVRCFMGGSALGAGRLNAGLRAGCQPTFPGFLECLVSGLNRLPISRRALLCQGRLDAPAEELYQVGSVLMEPTFRTVTGMSDLMIPGANVDYLIWPNSARQVGALADQDFDEAVLLAGTTFKVLAVRPAVAMPPADRTAFPRTAVLLRELAADDRLMPGLGTDDMAILDRLQRALQRRRSATPREVTDAEVVDRWGGSPLGLPELPAWGRSAGESGLVATVEEDGPQGAQGVEAS